MRRFRAIPDRPEQLEPLFDHDAKQTRLFLRFDAALPNMHLNWPHDQWLRKGAQDDKNKSTKGICRNLRLQRRGSFLMKIRLHTETPENRE